MNANVIGQTETTVTVEVKCNLCDNIEKFDLPKEGIRAYYRGSLIQNALPELSNAQREMLISGTCGNCWDEMFPEEE